MKKLFLLTMGTFMAVAVWGQQAKPDIKFEEEIYNFGQVPEDGGKVSHTFRFTNEGEQPLVVHNVKASCGCTTPDWTRKPVKPGDGGYVKATFDPMRRPGNFNKSIIVRSNAKESTVVLRITGKVKPREKTLADIYPRKMGDIRLKSSHLSFTKIAPDEVKTEELEFVNVSDSPVTIDVERVPEHIDVKIEPFEVAPEQKGKIVATFDAGKKDDWGFVVDRLYLKMNGETDRRNRINVSATIEEDFSEWSEEEMANAPSIEVNERVFNFGEIQQGEKVSHTFKLTNTGKSDLILRKIRASCGCTAIEPEKKVISPGESANIVARFNSRGMNGRQNKSVTIYSNDPHRSTLLLRLSGSVVK